MGHTFATMYHLPTDLNWNPFNWRWSLSNPFSLQFNYLRHFVVMMESCLILYYIQGIQVEIKEGIQSPWWQFCQTLYGDAKGWHHESEWELVFFCVWHSDHQVLGGEWNADHTRSLTTENVPSFSGSWPFTAFFFVCLSFFLLSFLFSFLMAFTILAGLIFPASTAYIAGTTAMCYHVPL